MSFDFTISSPNVPQGVYSAKFVSVEPTTHAEYGSGLRFDFQISEGKHAGKSVSRATGDKPTLRNSAGKVIAALVGAKPSEGLSVEVGSCIGRKYTVVVGETDSGFTRVTEIFLAEEESPSH